MWSLNAKNTWILIWNNYVSDILDEGECYGVCGEKGTRLIKYSDQCTRNLNTNETTCGESIRHESNTCAMDPCPEKAEYGHWTEWSKCSHTCVQNLVDKSVKSRSRSCISHCNGTDLIDTKECKVDFCTPECPPR